MLDFKEIFQAYKESQEKVWEHDRSKTVGASEIFACLRQTWFKKNTNNKYDPDESDDSWGAMLRGDMIEEHYVVPAVKNNLPEGMKLTMAGDKQITYVVGLNSATPDGLVIGATRDALAKYGVPDLKSNCFMLEIKSIDPRSNLREEKAIHRGQCQQQMGIIREKTKWRPYFAVILYVDASFVDNIKVFIVEYDPKVWKAAQKRADMIFNTDDPKDVTAEGLLMPDGCKYCKWTAACSLVQLGRIPKTKGDELAEDDKLDFVEMVDEIENLKRAKAEIEEDLKAAQEEVKEKLLVLDRRWFNFDHDGRKYEASWTSQKGRQSFDKKAAEEAGLDLSPYMKEGNPFEKFNLKVKED